MTVSGPRVQDFTTGTRELTVDVVASPAVELLMSLFVLGAGAKEEGEVDEVAAERRATWIEGVRSSVSPQLLADLDEFVGAGWVWLGLIGYAYDSKASTVAGFVDHLRGLDPVRVRRRILRMAWGKDEGKRDAIDPVAAGDTQLLATLEDADEACCLEAAARDLFELDPPASLHRLVDIVARFDAEVFHGGDDVIEILERDAADKRLMASSMEPSRLVETATGGVTFALQPEVSGIVLVPSIVSRPWVTINGFRGLRIFTYSVDEQLLTSDPDTPPSRLVEVYKALGDERRLRILRVLGDGPAGLREITDRVDLAKSTVFHHLRVLRTAGLVRVTIGDDKEYSLRTDAVPQAAQMLEGFLGTETEG